MGDDIQAFGSRGGYANYKGVMLCSRPEERQEIIKEKPWCSRVDPKDHIGLNPVRKNRAIIEKKCPNMALLKHKRWLKIFADEIKNKKNDAIIQGIEGELFKENVKKQSSTMRHGMKDGTYLKEYMDGDQQKIPRAKSNLYKNRNYEQDSPNDANFRSYDHRDNMDPRDIEYHNEPRQDIIYRRDGNYMDQEGRNPQYNSEPILDKHEHFLNSRGLTKDLSDVPEEVLPPIHNGYIRTSSIDPKNEDTLLLPPTTAFQHAMEHSMTNQSSARNKNPIKKKIPAYAMTSAQQEEVDDMECDDLLDFMDNLNPEKFIDDLEFKNLTTTLKKKVDDQQHDPDFIERLHKDIERRGVAKLQRQEMARENLANRPQNDDDDMFTNSGNGGRGEVHSVGSEQSREAIQNLKDKAEAAKYGNSDWDSRTGGEQKTFEDRISKHIADEILRTNMAFAKVHSNASVRKMLEQEVKKHVNQNRPIVDQNIKNSKQESLKLPNIIDNNKRNEMLGKHNTTQNLPYIYRNPAI